MQHPTPVLILAALILGALPTRAHAQVERLCDPANEDCRQILINYIRAERVGLDVAFWFMEDSFIASEIIARHRAGVPVRILMDTEANASTPRNADRLAEFKAAGIPMREKVSSGILHWKMMLFSGQGIVEFSGANFSSDAFVYSGSPYTNYVDEAIYFTGDPDVVNSFRTRYDNLWTDTSRYANYANITGGLTRRYDTYPQDPEMNFPPFESFAGRSVNLNNAETQRIDVIIYRITDRRHTDSIIAAVQRGIPARLITEPQQYRDAKRLWHSWNIDRLYMAGVQIRNRTHAGLNHQKLTLYYSQATSVTGSSNWTSPSDNSQDEHNYFTRKSFMFTWLRDHFERKWFNEAGVSETGPFAPLPPDAPTQPSPANGATGVGTSSVTLRWYAGFWAHSYDIYFGTSTNPPLAAADRNLGPSLSAGDLKSFTVNTTLASGTTYYWRVVAKTMANMTASSPLFSFTTAGTSTTPPPSGSLSPPWSSGDIGAVGVAGSASNSGSSFSVRGSGADIWGTADALHYAYQSFNGDVDVTARVTSIENIHAWTKAGVMIRGSLSSSAPQAMMLVSPGKGTAFQRRVASGGISTHTSGGSGTAPVWVKLERRGSTIRAYRSSSGSSWTLVGSDSFSIGSTIYVGLAVSSHDNSRAATATFDSVSVVAGSGGGTTPPPPGASDIVLWAGDASTVAGAWRFTGDSSAAGGVRMYQPDAGAAKITTASASPANYFELTFNAVAGQAYRIWIRGKAENNHYSNDSVFVQFSNSVNSSGSAMWRVGTTSATEIALEDCNGCGVSNWGWQDNGWGAGVLGPLVYFNVTGTQRIRFQTREDGFSIDQVVLSPSTYLNTSPGALKNDTRILPKTQ